MSAPWKRWKKVTALVVILWALTLGIHVGTLPDGVPLIGTKNSYFWDEFLSGKREMDVMAFMEVPHFQIGIPFLITYAGGAMPASVDLTITTDERHANSTVVIEQAFLKYSDGTQDEIIFPDRPRSGILSKYEIKDQQERTFYRATIGIPDCVREKQDFTVSFSGSIVSAEDRKPLSGEAGVIYSENSFIYLGWFLVLMR